MEGTGGQIGATGPTGTVGLTGFAGPEGAAGINGSPGLEGAAGLNGAVGLRGEVGLDGSAGPEGKAGVQGDIGATGPAGSTGTEGPKGAAGPQGVQGEIGGLGATGSRGADGPVGTAGPAGEVGPVGPTGPPGSSASPQYAYIYNLAAETVPLEAAVSFDSNGVMSSGIAHAPGTPGIALVNAGTYAVTFSVSGTGSNQIALFVNGGAVPGSVYGSGAGTQQNSGQAIVAIAAGDVLTVRNFTSSAAIGLATPIGGTQASTDASVMIEKLS